MNKKVSETLKEPGWEYFDPVSNTIPPCSEFSIILKADFSLPDGDEHEKDHTNHINGAYRALVNATHDPTRERSEIVRFKVYD